MFMELRKPLQSRKHKWMRFLSIFADNYNEWDRLPNCLANWDDLKVFSCKDEAKEFEKSSVFPVPETNTKQTLLYCGASRNISCSSTYPIFSKTVKCFQIKVEEKPARSNMGIGLAEKSFLMLERKFIGFNPYNIGCSSNGKAR